MRYHTYSNTQQLLHYIFPFTSLVLTILFATMVNDFKAPSTKNVDDLLDLNGHINTKLIFTPKGPTCENTTSLTPVLFQKLHNIKLSHTVFRVTTFFLFTSTKTALQILLQYVHDFEAYLTTLYSKLVDDNDIDPNFMT